MIRNNPNSKMETYPFSDPLLPSLPRGVAPSVLLKQVRNTVPFIFEPNFLTTDSNSTAYLVKLRELNRLLGSNDLQAGDELSLTHEEYFELCLCAHHATVASFVPTDVDNQIRFKLWHPSLGLETLSKMAALVVRSLGWDTTLVSMRWLKSPEKGEILSGHAGEWLATAVAAYAALRRKSPDQAADIAGLILRELHKEAQIFKELRKARDGIGILKASAIIAHNLGDLDRVIDIWNLPSDDPLREHLYKLGHTQRSSFVDSLLEAGKLNKAYTAIENHRHFALREPRCLRRSVDFLLPMGPFFDDWGILIAKHPGLDPKEVGAVVEALVDGWERLKGPIGYTRALTGILESFPGGFKALSDYVPARIARVLKSGTLRALCSIPRKRFDEQWNQMGLRVV